METWIGTMKGDGQRERPRAEVLDVGGLDPLGEHHGAGIALAITRISKFGSEPQS
jgi:hypothetical protein